MYWHSLDVRLPERAENIESLHSPKLVEILGRLAVILNSTAVIAFETNANAEPHVIGMYSADPCVALPFELTRFADPCLYQRKSWRSIENSTLQVLFSSEPVGSETLSTFLLRVSMELGVAIVVVASRHANSAMFTMADERAVARIAGWIEIALTAWSQCREDRQRNLGLQAALDQIGAAIILLDCHAHVAGSNRAAQALLEAGDGLRMSGRALTATTRGDAIRLNTAISHVLAGAAVAKLPVLAIQRTSRRPLIVAVLPTPVGHDVQAIILHVVEPDLDYVGAVEAACALYGMSGPETRLTTLIVTGSTLSEAATALRIQLPTARTYLQRAFAKTATNRQAALVHLVLSSLIRSAPGLSLTAM